MIRHKIVTGKNGRVVVVGRDDLMHYHLTDDSDKPLKFTPFKERQAVAIVTTPVKVYKKPHANALHKEYLLHNGRSMWLGFIPNFERLVNNMLEFEGRI